jgi:hypothetical protein
VLGSVDRRSYLDYFSYALQWPVPCRPLHITAVTLLNAPLLAAGRRRFVPAVRILAGDGAVLLASDFAPAADADHPQAVWLYCGALAAGCGGRGCLGLPLWPQSGAFWAEPGSGDALHLDLLPCGGGAAVSEDFRLELLDGLPAGGWSPGGGEGGGNNSEGGDEEDWEESSEHCASSDGGSSAAGPSDAAGRRHVGRLCLHTAFLGASSPVAFSAAALDGADPRRLRRDFAVLLHFEEPRPAASSASADESRRASSFRGSAPASPLAWPFPSPSGLVSVPTSPSRASPAPAHRDCSPAPLPLEGTLPSLLPRRRSSVVPSLPAGSFRRSARALARIPDGSASSTDQPCEARAAEPALDRGDLAPAPISGGSSMGNGHTDSAGTQRTEDPHWSAALGLSTVLIHEDDAIPPPFSSAHDHRLEHDSGAFEAASTRRATARRGTRRRTSGWAPPARLAPRFQRDVEGMFLSRMWAAAGQARVYERGDRLAAHGVLSRRLLVVDSGGLLMGPAPQPDSSGAAFGAGLAVGIDDLACEMSVLFAESPARQVGATHGHSRSVTLANLSEYYALSSRVARSAPLPSFHASIQPSKGCGRLLTFTAETVGRWATSSRTSSALCTKWRGR